MLKKRHGTLPFVLLPLLLCRAAQACPVCDSDRARLVRAGLFDAHLVPNLFVTVLPFVVLAAIVALTYYGLPHPRRGPEGRAGG